MNLHDRIREWLGINEALRQADTNRRLLLAISERLGDVQSNIKTVSSKIGILNQGFARVIAKLDSNFATSEFGPAKKAESDKLAEETIARLRAEQAVRDQYGYTPESGQ